MNIDLTICIPVYNCADFLGQALDSILPQTTRKIEVVVYDGGSLDWTHTLLENYINNWPNLHYYRSEVRGGIDVDMAKCVGFAKGKYCWLFSGDDVMRPRAIERALEWIKYKNDVYICKHTLCSKEMVVLSEHPVLQPDRQFTANLANESERLDWFERAVTTEAFFSFMSGLIVRRDKWSNGELPEAFNRSCWGHVARFFALIPKGLEVCYVPEIWLDQRGGNDSFADKGIVDRFRIAIEGYHNLAESFFGSATLEAFYIRRVIRNEFGLASFVSAKVLCKKNPEIENIQLLDKLVHMTYCDSSWEATRRRFCYSMFPCWLFVILKPIYVFFKSFLCKIKL